MRNDPHATASPLDLPRPLAHRYLGLRHGESLANCQGRIVSDPAVGCRDYGLSESGLAALLRQLPALLQGLGPLHVVASDFLRTRQTAAIVAGLVGCPVHWDPRLRERSFGELEGMSSELYRQVWAVDRQDPTHTRWGVESVHSVALRMLAVVREIESGPPPVAGRTETGRTETVVLVSHGDPLQILQCVLSGRSVAEHRSLPSLQPGELRELVV